MNIKEYLDILKDLWTPTNASKIRMAINNALETMGNNLKENIDRQDNVENQFQDVLDETTGKDVINGPEIIAARNGEANLKARLDKEKNEVAAQLAQIAINVKTFGATGDGVTDDYNSIQNAINYAIENNKKLYLPAGKYLISEPLRVSNDFVNGWRVFEVVGEFSGSAISALDEYGNKGTTIITNGTSGFEFEFYNYWNESVKISHLSFINRGSKAGTTAVHYKFNQTTYARKQLVKDINVSNFEEGITFSGYSEVMNDNYFGTTEIDFCHTYLTDKAIVFDNVFVNLISVKDSLFHGGGVHFINGAGGYFKFVDTHIEGARNGCFVLDSSIHIKIVLDNFSSENSGNNATGVFNSLRSNNLELIVNNQIYPFVFMDSTYNLPAKSIVSSNTNIGVSGESIVVRTPDTIHLRTIDDESYSVFLLPTNTNPKHKNSIFKEPGVAIESFKLPIDISKKYVGTTSHVLSNTKESFVASDDGYIYISWIGSRKTINNGFNAINIKINGVTFPIPIGYRWSAWEGTYVLVIPIKKDDVLKDAMINLYSQDYLTYANVSFSESGLRGNVFGGFPRTKIDYYTVENEGSIAIEDGVPYQNPFAVDVKVSARGSLYYNFISRGSGTNYSRVIDDVVKSTDSGLTIEDLSLIGHEQMYRKQIINNTGRTLRVRVVTEYLR